MPAILDITFQGFQQEAFHTLERIRENPHIEQYRIEKDNLRQFVQQPFACFRDDLVVNCIIPNRIILETERNVFSRILKNDFGAGGCHHHLWMAFYRPGRRRLNDYQLAHSISPRGFVTGLYVGENARDLLKSVRSRLTREGDLFHRVLSPLLESGVQIEIEVGRHQINLSKPDDRFSDDFRKIRGIWAYRSLERELVIQRKGMLVEDAINTIRDLWPLYLYYTRSD